MPAVDTGGSHCHVRHATTRCTSTARTVAGRAGRNWVTHARVGVAYDRHDALTNEAAYARHYKYMATPLQHHSYTIHTCLRQSRAALTPQANRLNLHT